MSGGDVRQALGLRAGPLSRPARLALVLGFAGLWLLGRRYTGIVHDATVYAAQGLRRLDPTLSADLFFSHGSQDAYTLFPLLYAGLIAAVGPGPAALAVTVLGQLAFVAAAAALVWRIGGGAARWWSLALLAVFSGFYGGMGVFRMAEPFATARSLAEPLVLAALASTLAARHGLALAALAGAVLLHPLVGATGVAVVYLWHAMEHRRLWWIAPVIVLGSAGLVVMKPELAAPFDRAWLAPVLERSPHLFIAQWEVADWARVFWGAGIVWLARQEAQPMLRRLLLAVLIAAGAGIALAALLVDAAGSAFAAALQLWRTHWVLHLLAIVMVPVVVAALWRRGGAGGAAAACVAASVCFGRAEQPAAAALVVAALWLASLSRARPGHLSGGAQRAVILAAACAASVGLLLEIQSRMPAAYGASATRTWTDDLQAVTTVGGLAPVLLILGVAAYSRYSRAALVLSAFVFLLGGIAWDARQPWPRFIDAAGGGRNAFQDVVPRGATVHWPGPYVRSWLLLGRPEWYNVDQGAGIVFSRATAIAYAERRRAARELEAEVQNCTMVASGCTIDPALVRRVCVRRDAPAYLVFGAPVREHAGLRWALPPGLGTPAAYLYRCDSFTK